MSDDRARHDTLGRIEREAEPYRGSTVRAQLAEVDREIQQRRKVYPRLVQGQKMRTSDASMHLARMLDVQATLRKLVEAQDKP